MCCGKWAARESAHANQVLLAIWVYGLGFGIGPLKVGCQAECTCQSITACNKDLGSRNRLPEMGCLGGGTC